MIPRKNIIMTSRTSVGQWDDSPTELQGHAYFLMVKTGIFLPTKVITLFTADTASTNVCGSMMLILRLSSSHLTARILEWIPWKLKVTQTITITDRNSILVHYDAVSDMDTVCSFTNHSYFNFSGVKNVSNYIVSIGADCYTPCRQQQYPHR